jgi:hypothetical protein
MEKDIGKIKKNETTDIVVRIDNFGGKPGLTIREFVTSDRYTGFSKSGTRIPPESFEDFKNIINSINKDMFEISEDQQQKLPKSESKEEHKEAEEEQDEEGK